MFSLCSFTFPSVLMVYATLTVLVVVINDLLSDLSSNSPLCSSIDLIENYGGNTSVYCKVQGTYNHSCTCRKCVSGTFCKCTKFSLVILLVF